MNDPEMKAISLNALAIWAEAQGYCLARLGRQPTEEELVQAIEELAESRKRARERIGEDRSEEEGP